MTKEDKDCARLQKPAWLKVRAPGSPEYIETRSIVKGLHLHTVCEEAHCPNIGDCWSHRTATFLILGEYCTRACSFCAVKHSAADLCPPDPLEPGRIGEAVAKLRLRHVVVTSVTRDDLPDQGAGHFAATVTEIHRSAPECRVELLIPDLQGSVAHLKKILDAGVDILNHNLETVPRLYPQVRPQASYQRSLTLLAAVNEIDPNTFTKSGIMAGLGETENEVLSVMDDLRSVNVDILTIGQYLQPASSNIAIKEYVTPETFEKYERLAFEKGFSHVESGALVRSSYHAWEQS